MAKEFKAYYGHVPRDRASIWYLAPLFMEVVFAAVVLFIIAAVLFS